MLCYGTKSQTGWHKPVIYHVTGSPLRIPGIQKLIAEATRECTEVHLRGHSAIVDLPLDIAILIVDLIYGSRPRSMERLIDTRNLLEAFQWKLPETYWKTRCDYWLVFEMDDLIREKRAAKWSRFCLGLEELLLERGWYCNSGLRTRQRALTSLGGIKEHFLNMIEK
ncbi:hypothetical protein APSETT444_000940 [Aspergillus pseudonomiae]